jgi:hypothetical protein
VWVRLPDGGLVEVPWIHRDHVHEPFGESAWRHVKTIVEQRAGRERREADLAQALDQVLRRAHPTPSAVRNAGTAGALSPNLPEQHRDQNDKERADTRTAASAHDRNDSAESADGLRCDVPVSAAPRQYGEGGVDDVAVGDIEWEEADSLDDLTAEDDQDEEPPGDTRPDGGFALWDAYEEAQRW